MKTNTFILKKEDMIKAKPKMSLHLASHYAIKLKLTINAKR